MEDMEDTEPFLIGNSKIYIYLSRYVHTFVTKATSTVPFRIKCVVWYDRLYNWAANLYWRCIHRIDTGDNWADVVGSYSENTCIDGSDVDMLSVRGRVYASEDDIEKERLHGLVVTSDSEMIPPGCCWLRRVRNTNEEGISEDQFFECSATEIDGHTHYDYHNNMDKIVCFRPAVTQGPDGFPYFSSKKFSEYHGRQGLTEYRWINRFLPRWNPNGPAFTQTYFGMFAVDVAICFRCLKGWPNSAQGWFTRERSHGWPSDELLSEVRESGFDVVAIPSKITTTETADLEWRISFRITETKLIKSFNETQRTCFLILKIINKQFIKDKDLVSTYIMKTLVFWMVEESESSIWEVVNTLTCLEKCLDRFCTWVEQGYCPSYFIPTYNLFRTKLTDMDGTFREQLPENIRKMGWKVILECEFFRDLSKIWKLSDGDENVLIKSLTSICV